MSEPTYPHFILSDGQYCHVLSDRLVIGKRTVPEPPPVPVNRLDYVLLIFQAAGVCVLGFFTVMTIMASYYMVTLTTAGLFLLLGISLIRTTGFTTTPAIMRDDIINVSLRKRSFGYDFFIIRYSGEGGKLWKRRLIIYDSEECARQAVTAMTNAGLLKQN